MTANQVFLIFFGFVAIVSLLLPAFSLKLGLKWARIANVSLLKAFGLCLLALLQPCRRRLRNFRLHVSAGAAFRVGDESYWGCHLLLGDLRRNLVDL
jgi:hypothetical protein